MSAKESRYFSSSSSLQEKCGVVGIYNGSDIKIKYKAGSIAARALWHRGQGGIGSVVNSEKGPQKYVKKGKNIDSVLPEEVVPKFLSIKKSNWITFHDRYGTSGGYGEENLQPIIIRSPTGITFTITHNGEFVALDNMKKSIREKLPKNASDTVIFSRYLKYAEGETPDEKILNALGNTRGAYSLLIGTNDALYAARDPFGIRPMVLGRYSDGWIIVSETHALDKLGVKTRREVKKGEIIKIDQNGFQILKEGSSGPGNFCDMEWAYFSRPDSLNPTHEAIDDSRHPERWLSNLVFRKKCGEALAKEYPISNANFVTGVPDSGVPAGTGYASAMKLPYEQNILRDHYDENGKNRVFMQDENLNEMVSMALGKHSLVPDKRVWKNATVVIVDDSIVRGTTFKAITKMMFYLGAREVHLLSAFPQIKFPCHLGVSMRTDNELIARRNRGNEELIAKELGATSVHYISQEAFIKARLEVGNPYTPKDPLNIFLENGGCGGCITGRYPIDKKGIVYQKELR